MLQLSNGAIFPGFILYFILYIIMRLMPNTFVRFHDKRPLISFPIVNFNLPFDVNEENWPKVKRVGGRTFLLFACVDALNAFCYAQGFYGSWQFSYSRTSGTIFCLCICSFLIATYLASKKV